VRLPAPGIVLVAAFTAFAGCNDKAAEPLPPPHAMTTEATGHYCGMNLAEHAGPKGQIILRSRAEPVWFTSVRDTVAFTLLPEEPKDIRAVYVSDMGKAPSWNDPGANNWIEARQAFFVIESNLKGGMGAAEAVPFVSRSDAEKFAGAHGGRVVTFDQIPRDYILGYVMPFHASRVLV
jgi:copper chaperone NosL